MEYGLFDPPCIPGCTMDDKLKSREDLIRELSELRGKIVDLEQCVLEDTRSQEALQTRIAEYEKFSALGRLTANVAHGIRNPITVIGGLAHRLKKMFPEGTKGKDYVDVIELESRKLEGILKDALLFSDKIFFKRERCDINTILRDIIPQFEDLYKTASISIKKQFGEIPGIYIDRERVTEVIKNLVVNAFDAMPRGGTITISTRKTSLNQKPFVTLQISDTGIGIPADKLDRIFEPFYSTKPNSEDTGLGLPISKKIIEGHGGLIKVDSTQGEGTSFTLFFPYRPD